MKNINVIKQGNVVNIGINGKLSRKVCGNATEADELFQLALRAKADPSDENIMAIRCYLNETTRVGLLAGFETDPETGRVYMAGFNTPVPDTLIEVIKEYHECNYPMDAIVNFWKLLMLNPDTRVRTDLFDFITTHDFVLTDAGYMVVYKAVTDKTEDSDATAFAEFVNRQYLHVKKDWGTSANKYVVYRDIANDTWDITKKKTANRWDEKEKNVEILGKLGELHDSLFTGEVDVEDESTPLFTDMHTRTMNIKLGVPVQQDRKDCDADYRIDCSNGLHVGATKYVESFARGSSKVLVCYVNPANVVAVPLRDHSKMRCCEYFPFAMATYENDKIDVIEQAYFESDYCEYESEELEKQIAKIHAEELPIETAQKAEVEVRPMSELLKIVESRLIDIE
jgi:hypothetical protein